MDPTANPVVRVRPITALGRAILAVQSISREDLERMARTGGDLEAEERAARMIVAAYTDGDPDDLGPLDS